MSLFGSDEDERYSDAAINRAIRKRLLEQAAALGKSGAAAPSAKFVNNVYGGGGVQDRMGGGSPIDPEDDPFSYFVDITRKDLPDVHPVTGKPIGWEKTVHRHRGKKDGSSGSGAPGNGGSPKKKAR